ncbi:uncharacterized protein B0T23DRAFT_79666 [Neurospora hispaniola]|uniref:Secreted protein n=1 Tax=Neurospora hispaniola TaxID=588809 RepID=A0AAJ0ID22_9PEZI|nr:hypothetical protein B0T23DRAFT_79666 [Neurospora hispaniola]
MGYIGMGLLSLFFFLFRCLISFSDFHSLFELRSRFTIQPFLHWRGFGVSMLAEHSVATKLTQCQKEKERSPKIPEWHCYVLGHCTTKGKD